ncbi:MAG: hypothetical protein H6924_10515 [Alphaproteobacteria bacterium]|nr:hypothetical protein [Alphaproteobacteria bacterium]
MKFRAIRHAVLVLAALCVPVALSGCGDTRITICPVPAILAETASMTVIKPGAAPDPANEQYSVALVNAESSCSYNRKEGTTTSDLTLTFHATRPPSPSAASYSVPYFVVVSENSKLFDKKLYTLNFRFAPGAVSADIKQSPNDIEIKIANGKLPWNYQLMAGMQLTAEQMAYNKKIGRYLP